MYRNKAASVRVISLLAGQIGVEEDLLHEISLGVEPEDGVIWVYGLGDRGVRTRAHRVPRGVEFWELARESDELLRF